MSHQSPYAVFWQTKEALETLEVVKLQLHDWTVHRQGRNASST